jgi:tetratricopeptide (TPR) repeat protein
MTFKIASVSLRQHLCPEPMLGRMTASVRFVVWGGDAGRALAGRPRTGDRRPRGHVGGDLVDQAHTLQVSGRIWLSQGGFAEAIDCNRRAFDCYRTADHRSGQASALNSIGWIHSLAGEHEAAIASCEQALDLMRAIGHRAGQADTLDSLGLAHHRLGRHAEAADLYDRAVALYNTAGAANTLVRLADPLLATGDTEAAVHALERASAAFEELAHPSAAVVRDRLAGTRTARRQDR